MTMQTPPGMPDEMMAEIQRIARQTRALIETADMPLNASATLVLMVGYIITAKHNGMTREQFHTAVNNVWALLDAQDAERARG
jgi:hypothetical protein